MPLTGEVLERTTIVSPGGRRLEVEVLRVSPASANIKALRATDDAWARLAAQWRKQELPFAVVNHAEFAADTAFLAAYELSQGGTGVLAVQAAEEILGLAIWRRRNGDAYIDLVTTSPLYQPGAPVADQYRGIGTALVRNLGREFEAKGAQVAWLSALDEEAKRFWRARGFTCDDHRCSLRQPSCLIEGCSDVYPDDPGGGDLVAATDETARRRVR